MVDSDTKANLSQAYDPSSTTDSLRDLYDKWSDSYDNVFGNFYNGPKYAAQTLNKILSDKHARILDCGCGTGLVGEQLHNMGFDNIDGVDLSEESLEVARNKGVYAKLTAAALGPDPLEGVSKDSYDAIICSGVFVDGHLTDNVFKEWTRIVKPGGPIVIVVNEKYTHLVKGDTFKNMVESKVIKVEDESYDAAYVTTGDDKNAGCYVLTVRVL
ncbi:methyltransferase-like protein 27 [Ptychodera flava]|uniref:methyltransferase-like protein 27 n=1 Tax=Ptychodera flava TaxID=63121 RepID=UPI00396A4EAD